MPVALSARTAAAWGVGVGDVLDLSVGQGARRLVSPTAVVVSGTFEPLDAADEVWAAEPRMLGIAKILTPQGGTTDQATAIAPLESYSVLADGLWRGPVDEPPPSPSPALDHAWRYTLDADRLTRADVGLLRDFLVRLDTDPGVWARAEHVPAVSTGLGRLLDRYERDVAVTGVLTSFVTGGVTALAVLVLALTALLGAQRRDREVRLLRARGASRRQVLALVGVATSVLALPLAVLAAGAVVLLVPGDTTSAAWVEVALVLVLPPLVAVLATARRVRAIDEPAQESTRSVRAARRIVLEVAVVILAVLAVTTVRSRGAVIAAGRTDWYAAVTPVLVALAAAVVALRVMPWPVARLARLAERGRGLVGFVGLTRAARTGASAAVPLAALVVGATLVTLMATLTASVSDQRELAALRAVGADARVDAARIDAPDVTALAARPGVEAAIPAHVDAAATLSAGGRVTLRGRRRGRPGALRGAAGGHSARLHAAGCVRRRPAPGGAERRTGRGRPRPRAARPEHPGAPGGHGAGPGARRVRAGSGGRPRPARRARRGAAHHPAQHGVPARVARRAARPRRPRRPATARSSAAW